MSYYQIGAAALEKHPHTCPQCLTVWDHTESSFGDVSDHSCPNCGQVQWLVGAVESKSEHKWMGALAPVGMVGIAFMIMKIMTSKSRIV